VRGTEILRNASPRRDAPDASRSRQAPARTSGGTFYPTRRSGLWRIPNSVGWIGSLAGALAPWKICLFQPTRRRRPDSHPGSLRDGAQTHLSVNKRPEGQPVACSIRRTAQGRGRIDRKASRHERRLTPIPTVYRTSVPVREAAGAGRLAPPAGGNRPRTPKAARRSSLSRSSLGCTEVQPREPKHSAIRRLRVP
jgi:hypothetical protein